MDLGESALQNYSRVEKIGEGTFFNFFIVQLLETLSLRHIY